MNSGKRRSSNCETRTNPHLCGRLIRCDQSELSRLLRSRLGVRTPPAAGLERKMGLSALRRDAVRMSKSGRARTAGRATWVQ
jgi:hypothetical protein